MSTSSNRPSPKVGRPRVYGLRPVEKFANPEAAVLAGVLGEMSERVFDLISDLPGDLLDFIPERGNNSIAMLVLHMIAAEASWVARVSQMQPQEWLRLQIASGTRDASGELPRAQENASALIAAGRRVRNSWTLPFLIHQKEIDRPVTEGNRTMTVRGVVNHLVWHWIYHSGQIGLLRRLAGSKYQWTFDSTIGDSE